MKKYILLLFLVFFTNNTYHHDNIFIENIEEDFFNKINSNEENLCIVFLGKNNNICIAEYLIYNDGYTYINVVK